MKKFLMTIIAVLLPLLASADDNGTCGENLTWSYVEATKTLTISGTGEMEDYTPFLHAPWWSFNNSIKNIIIESGVTSIGGSAFNTCSSLTSINIPNSVTSIGPYAFCECSGLTSITIPNSVTSIGGSAFSNCSGLTSITIPNSVESIGSHAFYGTGWYMNQPDGLVYAGKVAYEYKGTMPDKTSITIKDGTLGIADDAFYRCSRLTSITIPNSVTSIGSDVFANCSGLTSITVNSGNTMYDSRDNCNAIIETSSNTIVAGCVNTTIPHSVKNIGRDAFRGCTGLTSITIPNSVTSIREYAFRDCSSLISIMIPNSVTSIGQGAFYRCSGLTSIIVEDGNVNYDSRNNCNAIIDKTIDYYNQLIVGCKNTIIPNSVRSIEGRAFSSCSGLTSITIPNSVESIGSYAFENCSGLTSIDIPNSVVFIGERAFSGCSNLTSFTFPNSVSLIMTYLFMECSSLTSITIPSSVTWILGDIIDSYSNLKYICISPEKYPCSSSLGNTTCQYIMPQVAFDGGIPDDIINYATYSVAPKYIKVKSTTATSAILELTPVDIAGDYSKGTTIYEVTMYDLKPGASISGSWKLGTADQGIVSISDAKTLNLVMEVQAAKAMSTTKAKLSATVDEPNDDKHYGFEWLRYDAPDNMTPNRVSAPLYNGQIVGTLSGLNPDIYYKYRPFYKADDGTMFQGEWEAFITGDANVFFEPEVHTKEPVALTKDGAQLSGVWVEGTEDIQEKGFEYWPKNSGARPATRGDHVTAIIVKGDETSVTLEGLDPGTEYVYRSYMRTASGTVYGEEMTFKTPLMGDANDDGKVNVADVVEVVNAKAGNPSASFSMTNADVDGNGSISEAEIVKIIIQK